MSKSVQSVKNSLKFKAQVKEGVLSVRVGVKKYTLPVAVRILSNEGYMFLSFPATSELYRMDTKVLKPLDPKGDASAAYTALNPGRRRGRRRASQVSLPSDLANALKSLPAGYKLGFDASGAPRLVKMRKRRAKKA